ncbi:MAG: RNA polymerase sigma factor RpoD/SigA [Chitinophagaceae bacterium]|nr:RNA polymerase sigma factor RpoD/SigA [Chitinophagaceae bacterium]
MRQLKISKSITNRDSQSLEKYLQEISKLKMISADEEVALCMLVKQGDQAAIQQLVKANLRFVVSVAKQYQHRGISLSDLVNEGNIGLISAVARFDSTRGFKFISYAVWWIRQSILLALASDGRMVRLPANRVSVNNRIQKVISAMEQDLERMPSEEELAGVMNMNVADVMYCMTDTSRYVSLDAPISDGEGGTMMDNLPSTDSVTTDSKLYHTESLKKEMLRSMQRLTIRQQEILCSLFGIGECEPLSLEQIGKKFDVSPERIRQIKDKAIKTLKTKDNRGILRSFL